MTDTATHQGLRQLQAAINASIDEYVQTSPEGDSNKGKLAELQESIIDQASKIRAEVASPVTRVLELSWGVSLSSVMTRSRT